MTKQTVKAKAEVPAAVVARARSRTRGGNGNGNGHDDARILQDFVEALEAMRAGDFSARMASDYTGLAGKIADLFNEIVSTNEHMAEQLERVGEVVGREGKTKHRVKFSLAGGAWGEMESSVNGLVDDLLWPTTEVTRAIGAVARGDLLQTVPMDVDGRPLQGEFLRSASIVNTMIKQLSVFTSEVTRVAREVGSEGKLGGQAQVQDVKGMGNLHTKACRQRKRDGAIMLKVIVDEIGITETARAHGFALPLEPTKADLEAVTELLIKALITATESR
jgi:hypothetical protein